MAANVSVSKGRSQGCGPTIWLAGSPDELKEWMPLGIAGIVTITVVAGVAMTLGWLGCGAAAAVMAVSYTHLTLPTSDLV